MSVDSNCYLYKGDKPFRLLKWKVNAGSQIFPSTVLLTYAIEEDEKAERKLKSDVDGMVQTLLAQEGHLVQPGDALLELKSCTHEVIIKELCAQCGADLRQLSRQNLQEMVATRSFSMVHVVPELKCSLKQAKQLDEADETRLLKARKLILLVDLDQTLIHTTNENVPTNLKDVHHFQLYGSKSPWYHTRLRPQTLFFLEQISRYYELHIFTFGARMYAHKIASILDPDRKLFSHRILSRDECFDGTSKTGNLKSLFPRGDNMVCIIDDREDVWNFAPNVVHVKPYVYFCNTGDINAPPNAPPRVLSEETSQHRNEPSVDEASSVKKGGDGANNSDWKNSSMAEDSSDAGTVDENLPQCSSTNSEAEAQNSNENHTSPNESNIKDPEESINDSADSSFEKDQDDDDDDYLLYLEEILISIHKAYFDIYDEMVSQKSSSSPDLKNIIPYVRRKVLQGVNIVFSGVIPTNTDPEKSSLWVLAKSFGANITSDLILDGTNATTHIIASKMGTAKLNKARKVKGIHIVTPSWLICCATRWERVDEQLYPLKKNSSSLSFPKKFKKHMRPDKSLFKREKPLRKTATEETNETPKFSNVLNFSLEELEVMDKEVNDELEDSSGSEGSDHGSDQMSHGSRKRKRNNRTFAEVKLKAADPLNHHSEQIASNDTSYDEPILSSSSGSNSASNDDDDDELAAAVEQKLLNSIPSLSN